MIKRIGILGLGVVGEAVVKTLLRYKHLIEKRTSLKIEVRKVCDIKKEKKKIVSRWNIPFTTDPYEVIEDSTIDIVVELIGGINPAKKYLLSALKKGKDIVTANKALLAQCGKEIFSTAAMLNRNIGFEASVCGAIPIIKSISEGLVSCQINKLYGILNGTTNYILYKMHKDKVKFKDALKEAQKKGFAERLPQLDLEGIDALHKLCILTYLSFGRWPPIGDIYVEGISQITPLDIVYAEELSYRIKLLAIAKKENKKLSLRVHPTLVRRDHPLCEVNYAFNAVWLDTYPAGQLLFYGEGAGGVPTSSAVVADIVGVSLGRCLPQIKKEDIQFEDINNLKTRYYIRFMACDKPGVLAKISKILASFKISIASVTQKERSRGQFVPIVMLTHEAREIDLKRALKKIDKLEIIYPPSQLIRIEDL
ncbi:MAG: homoserine dehydrogenase [Candidatus Omnitrophica bacterium]|nr:homoserine dehydrogenase [Candidatus Omnitrophota bacterium]